MDIRKSRWTRERIARMGFLVGSGWDPKRIANDPIVDCRAKTVQCQANRYGLIFRDAPIRLNPQHAEVFDKAASKRFTTRESLIRLLLIIMAEEPNLIDNVLDDGE